MVKAKSFFCTVFRTLFICVKQKKSNACYLTEEHPQGDFSDLKRKDEELLNRACGPCGPDYPAC